MKKFNLLLMFLIIIVSGSIFIGCSIKPNSITNVEINKNKDKIVITISIPLDIYGNKTNGRNVEGDNMPFNIYWKESTSTGESSKINSGYYDTLYTNFFFKIEINKDYINKELIIYIESLEKDLMIIRKIKII